MSSAKEVAQRALITYRGERHEEYMAIARGEGRIQGGILGFFVGFLTVFVMLFLALPHAT